MSLRPQTIRADTLDLQDHSTPSAKDHTHQPVSHPNPLGGGPAAPHQEAELRHAAHDRQIEEHQLSNGYYGYESNNRDLGTTDIRSRAGTPYQDQSDSHLDDGFPDGDDDIMEEDLMDDKISSSPSIDEDDINFDFVYALHTFIATVEGQANATKGDTMVLLDDSNSYWWLVRILKDSSIGYLPAEHIETPTERLARLNKHKNIDLSATMLGDTAEKSKNPLKKAMRRRNAKTVTFNPPTYYEANEPDWSDIEAEGESNIVNGVTNSNRNSGMQVDREAISTTDGTSGAKRDRAPNAEGADEKLGITGKDAAAIRAKNVELRHTDSFLRDDKTESTKISLTPDLLREEASGRSSESSQTGMTSLDATENPGRVSPSSDRARKEVKQKDKKPGMLRGLFNRKEKKVKIDEGAGAPIEKHDESSPVQTSVESGRSSPSIISQNPQAMAAKRPATKLVKTPPPSTAAPANGILKQQQPAEKLQSLRTRSSNTIITPRSGPASTNLSRPGSALDRAMSPEPQYQRIASPEPRTNLPEAPHRIMSPEPPERVLSPEPTLPMGAATLASRNAFASNPMYASMTPPNRAPPAPVPQGALPATPKSALSIGKSVIGPVAAPSRSLDESNTRISPAPGNMNNGIPETSGKTSTESYSTIPSLANTSSSDDFATSTEQHADMSNVDPSLRVAKQGTDINAIASQSTVAEEELENNEPLLEWDDEALLNYLDTSSANDVRDMLLIVQDTTGVKPLPHDHPDMLELGFAEQREKLDEMSQSLDHLLMDFLARREKVT